MTLIIDAFNIIADSPVVFIDQSGTHSSLTGRRMDDTPEHLITPDRVVQIYGQGVASLATASTCHLEATWTITDTVYLSGALEGLGKFGIQTALIQYASAYNRMLKDAQGKIAQLRNSNGSVRFLSAVATVGEFEYPDTSEEYYNAVEYTITLTENIG